MISGENLVERVRSKSCENRSQAKANRPSSGRRISWVGFTGLQSQVNPKLAHGRNGPIGGAATSNRKPTDLDNR
jgi:hypothetical protein